MPADRLFPQGSSLLQAVGLQGDPAGHGKTTKEQLKGATMENVQPVIGITATCLEAAGIGVIALGAVFSTMHAAVGYFRQAATVDLYAGYRRQLSRAILLGLEFLVAADIIRTVAIEPTFTSVGILGAIVIIRTFLSFTLEVEVSGRWPWSHPAPTQEGNTLQRKG